MTRFPLLYLLRHGYRVAAGLAVLGTLVLLAFLVVVTQDVGAVVIGGLALLIVVPAAVVSLLVMGEGIAVVLAIEDHLWHLRSGGAGVVPPAAPGLARSWRSS